MRAERLIPVMLLLVTGLSSTACSRDRATADGGSQTAQRQVTRRSASSAPVSFVNRVWQVDSSSSVARGQLYVFLSDGTLVITSTHSKPALGSWKRDTGGLTMIEEGRPHRVTMLRSNADTFRIRISNPGEPVDITFVPGTELPKP